MGIQGSSNPSVSSFHGTNIGAAAESSPALKTLTPGEKKVQAQAAILTKKMEAKLDSLSGKNIQKMDTKQLTTHLKKCDKTARELHKLARKNPQLSHALGESSSVKSFQSHTGEAILAGQESVRGKNLSMQAFERSGRLEVKMELVEAALSRRSEAPNHISTPLTEPEIKEAVASLKDVAKASAEDFAKLEQIFSSKSQMEQLNGYLRAHDADELGMPEETKDTLAELTYIASRLSDHKQTLEGLHQKLTDSSLPAEKRTLGANEAWLLDHIGDGHEHFSKMDLSKAGQCPLLSKMASPAFSKDNIERIAKHRTQNLKPGDIVLFSGAKYRAYKGYTKDKEDAIQIRLTGSETVHAEVIHTKTKDGHAVNQGLWDIPKVSQNL